MIGPPPSPVPSASNIYGGGTFSQNSKRNFRDYSDGVSNTFLVGERRAPMVQGGTYVGGDTIWAGIGDEVSWQGIALHVGDCAFGNGLNFKSATAPNLTSSSIPYSGFSSTHVGGGHFLMGDGAVRFLSENISQGTAGVAGSTYQNLATCNDGQVLGEF
jgi:hypothetical protein